MKSKSSSTRKSKPKAPGNYIDGFVKQMFGRVMVFIDFLTNYADPKFVAEIDLSKIELAPTHYLGAKGDERIVDLVWRCPLRYSYRGGNGSLMAVIIFEHQGDSLKKIPEKLIRYISAIWDAERKEGKKVLSAPYFIILRTGKKAHRGQLPTLAHSLPKDSEGKPLGHIPEFKYDVVDLPFWDFNDLVGGAVLRSALMMLHKITGGKLDDFPEAFRPLLELPDGERVEVTKEMLDFADVAFKANNRRLDAAIVSKALKIFKDKEQDMIKSYIDELREEGLTKGIAIGTTKGKAEGKIEAVLTVLRTRFNRVPKEVEKAIRQMSDPIALDSWTAHAATCQSMREFAESVK